VQAGGLSFAQTLGGDADRVEAVILEVRVALAVLVMALASAVKDPAVELDDQPLGIEHDIDLVAVQPDVETVGRQIVFLGEPLEGAFEL
jgi:hypothetical protein